MFSAYLEEKNLGKTRLFLKKQCFLIIVGHWTVKYQTLSKRFGHECPNSLLGAHRKISRRKVSLGKIFILSTSDIRPNFFCLFVGKRLDVLVKIEICMSIGTFPGNFFALKKTTFILSSGKLFRQVCQKCSLRVRRNILRRNLPLGNLIFTNVFTH